MRTMLLSFKADVYQKVITGEKIYEHRKVFPDEPIKAYLYVSTPVKAVVGIMHLNNRTAIEEWKEKYRFACIFSVARWNGFQRFSVRLNGRNICRRNARWSIYYRSFIRKAIEYNVCYAK